MCSTLTRGPLRASCWLSACTISTPFRSPGYDSSDGILLTLNAKQSVVVGLTRAVVGSNREKNEDFDRNLWNVVDCLNAQPGLIGYSVRKQLFGDELWTMTVWKDEASLIAFVQSQSHTRAIDEHGRPVPRRPGDLVDLRESRSVVFPETESLP